MSEFKRNHTFKEMKAESSRIMSKYNDRIAVIVEKDPNCKSLQSIDENKYLVPKEITMGQFIQIVRKRVKISPEKSIFCFVNNNTIPTSSKTIKDIYDTYKDDTGFLFITITEENVYG